MKVRNGFVSNSSTSSFILLVKPNKVKDIDFILRHALRSGEVTPCKSVPERQRELKKEIRDLCKDTTFAQEMLDKLGDLFSDTAFELHEFCDYIDMMTNPGWNSGRGIRNYRTYPQPRRLKRDRTRYHDALRKTLTSIADARSKCEIELEQLTGNEKWSIVAFEEDLQWGHLRSMVDELVKDGNAIVLHQKTS